MNFFLSVPAGQKMFALTCCLAIYATGCSSLEDRTAVDPALEFQRAKPIDASKYVVLNRTTLFQTESMYGTMEARIVGTLASLPKRFPQCAQLSKYSEDMLDDQRKFRLELLDMLNQLRSAAGNGGAIYEFEWTDGATREFGLLALRDGEIMRREVLLIEEIPQNQ